VARLHRLGEGDAIGVRDLTAVGEDLNGDGALVHGSGGELISAQPLQVHQSRGEGEEDDDGQDEENPRATAGVAEPNRARGTRRGRAAE